MQVLGNGAPATAIFFTTYLLLNGLTVEPLKLLRIWGKSLLFQVSPHFFQYSMYMSSAMRRASNEILCPCFAAAACFTLAAVLPYACRMGNPASTDPCCQARILNSKSYATAASLTPAAHPHRRCTHPVVRLETT